MDPVRHIRNTHYFAVTVGDPEPWIMKPSPGHYVPFRHGISPGGLAWFFDPKEGLFIYDVAARSLRRNIRLPAATDSNGKPSHDHSSYQMLQSPCGRMLYRLAGHGIQSVDLRVVDLDRQAVVKTVEGLPGGIKPLRSAVLDGRGNIIYPALVGDAGRRDPGLASIDPRVGKCRNGILPGQQFQRKPAFAKPRRSLLATLGQFPSAAGHAAGRGLFQLRA